MASTSNPPGQYPTEIREAAKVARELRRDYPPGPKQVYLVQQRLKALHQDPLEAAHCTTRQLRSCAAGKSTQAAAKVLREIRPLSQSIDDPFCHGRSLAAILYGLAVAADN